MKAILKVVSIFLFFSVLIMSCAPVTAVPVPTETIPPTKTLLPTNTTILEPSATATESEVDEMFTIPTRPSSLVDTPTPISTPLANNSSAKLNNLSEQDMLHLIDEMNKYSYHNFPSFQDWWTDGKFVDSQEPVAFVIQEYLYRFPQSPSADRLRWQLAFIDSVTLGGARGNQYGDKWLISELQRGIDQGNVSPDKLEAILDPYWFKIDYSQSVDNLFGDGKTAWFYVLSPQVWAGEKDFPKSAKFFDRGGLFIIVHEINESKYRIELLENAWNFLNGSSSLFNISDTNKNGIPEIALNLWVQGGTMCGGNLKIFEWRNDSFVDLTKGEIKISDCSDNYEYSIVDGKPSIVFHQFTRTTSSVYTWNGIYYEFTGYQYSTPLERWSAARSSSEEVDAIEATISSGNKDGLSSSQIDFLRFRLGIAYALNSDPQHSKQVLQDLADNPLDKTRTIYSKFAMSFLRYYSGDQSLSLACKKSREILDQASGSLSSVDEEKLFGISFDFVFGPGMLRCYDSDVFELLVNRMPTQDDNIANELRNNGMNLYYAEKQDVNLDGVSNEWLIIFDDGIYAVVQNGSHYKAVEIEYFWGGDVTQYANAKVNISHWTGIQNPIMVVSTDQEFEILGLKDDYLSTVLGYGYDVEDVSFSSQENPARYQVFSIKPKPDNENYYGVPWSGYRWDPDHQQFRDDLIEYELFIERDPIKAVEIAKTILPTLMDWRGLDSVSYWLPRYIYLCGLSYEFSGDAQKAAEIYWQLWHDFPESHYALLARYKLELVNP